MAKTTSADFYSMEIPQTKHQQSSTMLRRPGASASVKLAGC